MPYDVDPSYTEHYMFKAYDSKLPEKCRAEGECWYCNATHSNLDL